MILGRLSDKIGKKPIIIFSTLCGAGAYLLTSEFFFQLKGYHTYMFFIIAIL